MSAEMPQPADVLSTLAVAKCSELTFYTDTSYLLDEIGPHAIDFTLEAYHRAFHRFLKQVYGEHRSQIPLMDFPEASIVITHKPEVFRNLYPKPSKFDMLPNWVRGYVNFKNSLYVRWLKDGESLPTDNLNGAAHEFTHAIVPDILGIPATYLSKVWPTWINETFAVGLNQQRPIEWLQNELQQPTVIVPSIRSIQENGIFHHDRRPPEENVAYQYCYFVSEEVGRDIQATLHPEHSKIFPLMAICELTQQAYRNGIPTFMGALDSIGVDAIAAENRCRERLSIPAYIPDTDSAL